jgi:hypothetical protein
MGKIEIPQSLIKQYKERKINRKEIAKKFNVRPHLIAKELYNRGVEIWDLTPQSRLLFFLKIVNLYERKKLNREKIKEKYGISWKYINTIFNRYNVIKWDRMVGDEQMRIKSEFWDWVYNEHPDPQYAVMIYSYNRDTINISRKTR